MKNLKKYFMIIMSLVFLVYLVSVYIAEKRTRQIPAPPEKKAARCTGDDFEIKDVKWHAEGIEAVAVIDSITIKNTGDADCKDIRGVVRFISQDKTELGRTDFVINEKLPSKQMKTFKGINVGRLPSPKVHAASVAISGATYISLLPSRALLSVTSSANSISPPMGRP